MLKILDSQLIKLLDKTIIDEENVVSSLIEKKALQFIPFDITVQLTNGSTHTCHFDGTTEVTVRDVVTQLENIGGFRQSAIELYTENSNTPLEINTPVTYETTKLLCTIKPIIIQKNFRGMEISKRDAEITKLSYEKHQVKLTFGPRTQVHDLTDKIESSEPMYDFNPNTWDAQLRERLNNIRLLVSLNIPHSNLGEEGTLWLAALLRANQTLTSLNICNNNIGIQDKNGTQTALTALVDSLKSHSSLDSIDLSRNNLFDEDGRCAGNTISELLKVEGHPLNVLNLSECCVQDTSTGGPSFVRALADGLKGSTLRSLNLSKNNIGFRTLPGGWTESRNSITDWRGDEVDWYFEYVSPTDTHTTQHPGTSEGFTTLMEAVATMTLLETLDISHNQLMTKSAGKALANALSGNSTLTVLDVSHNNWGQRKLKYDGDGVSFSQELSKGLETNTGLTSLNMNENGLSAHQCTWEEKYDDTQEKIWYAPPSGGTGQFIEDVPTKHVETGVVELLKSLEKHPSLKQLYMQYNNMMTRTIGISIGKMVKECNTLLTLDISNNNWVTKIDEYYGNHSYGGNPAGFFFQMKRLTSNFRDVSLTNLQIHNNAISEKTTNFFQKSTLNVSL